VTTDSGLWRLLDRLGITYKRGRHYTYSPEHLQPGTPTARNTYSPDPDYQEKRDYIQEKLDQARQKPERYAFLYQEEFVSGRVRVLPEAVVG